MGYSKLEPKFYLGRIVATSGVMSLGIDLIPFIRRHHCGEWGTSVPTTSKPMIWR